VDAQRGIARRMVVGLPPAGIDRGWERDFTMYAPAGVILFRRDFRDLEDLRRLTRRLRELTRPRRLFITMDEEGGFVSQLGDLLVVPPSALVLGRGGQPGDAEWAARVTGQRLRGLGVDWVFAPVADIHSRPANPVIGPRAFGSDPTEVARCVAEQVRGFQAAGVACTLKHFPGHGDTERDSHHELPRCEASRETLAARELVPFRGALEAEAVMTAHVVYPALDPDRPGTFSPAVCGGLLRGQLGYAGVCITDALEMKGAAEGRAAYEIARAALEAGCDLLLFAFHDEAVRQARYQLARALTEGSLPRVGFDEARPRLLALDRRIAEPSAEELAAPLESLTPAGWEPRLGAIVERAIRWAGALPAEAGAGPWRVNEPPWPYGESLADFIHGQGIPRSGIEGGGALEVAAIASRVPLPAGEMERLRQGCATRPTVVIAFQNDAFLAELPEAALRVSAPDPTPLTRRVVARQLVQRARQAAGV
jgi:beta-glucosidase-like glycosyl hydrolase